MIEIKEEFKKLIPALSAEEYAQLEANILEEGIREPIITWNGFIIDGHNRYDIAQRFSLECKSTSMHFNNEIDVIIWMVLNQFGRRNLSNYQRSVLALELEEVFSKKAKEKERIRKTTSQKSDESLQEVSTKKELSKVASVSHDTIAKVKKIQAKAPEEVKAKLATGEVSINAAYKEIKKEEKKEELKQIKSKISSELNNVDINNIPEKFDVIYADPPWKYEFSETTNRDIENHYTTMKSIDIAKMNVPANDNCVLFMWATAPKLVEAIEVMHGWGFEYKTCAVWDKEKIGMGYWFRGQHELLMVGVKGKMSPPHSSIRISSVIRETRGKHSRKPNLVAEYIELAFYDKSKIELFCREPRKGWYSFGNQI